VCDASRQLGGASLSMTFVESVPGRKHFLDTPLHRIYQGTV